MAFKKILILGLSLLALAGCISYRIKQGEGPYDSGLVVYRDGSPIAEYTVGKDNTFPTERELAQERFSRRRSTVEYYYQKMEKIQNPLARIAEYPAAMGRLVIGIFKTPITLINDRRYERDPEYRKEVDQAQEQEDAGKHQQVKELQAELESYVRKDLESESPQQN